MPELLSWVVPTWTRWAWAPSASTVMTAAPSRTRLMRLTSLVALLLEVLSSQSPTRLLVLLALILVALSTTLRIALACSQSNHLSDALADSARSSTPRLTRRLVLSVTPSMIFIHSSVSLTRMPNLYAQTLLFLCSFYFFRHHAGCRLARL